MKTWISVKDELPPDNWSGLVIADARPDKPVFAHTSDKCYRNNFPYSGHFIGPWRNALLIGEHVKSKAAILMWLKITEDDELYPEIPIKDLI